MKKQQKLTEEKKILVSGIIKKELLSSKYLVEAVFVTQKNGVTVEYPMCLVCAVSGKIRKNMILLKKGDLVDVEVSLYDLNVGLIVFRKKSS